TLVAKQNLALMYWRYQGKYDQAKELLTEVIEGYLRTANEDTAEACRAVHNLGMICWRQKRPAEAEAYLKRALAGFRKVFGDDHPDTLMAMDDLGQVYVFDLKK